MNQAQRQYIAIDLMSFYASVECVERDLNLLDACLVVADKSCTEKTICLAVSPSLKAFGIPGRPRLFEVVQKVREINRTRGRCGTSTSGQELAARHDLAVDYIVAPPRMQLYVDYSTRIYEVYIRMFGAHMELVEKYFPFVRDTNTIKKDEENGSAEQSNNINSVYTDDRDIIFHSIAQSYYYEDYETE